MNTNHPATIHHALAYIAALALSPLAHGWEIPPAFELLVAHADVDFPAAAHWLLGQPPRPR